MMFGFVYIKLKYLFKKKQFYVNLDEVKKIVRKIIGNVWRKVLKEKKNSIDGFISFIIFLYLEFCMVKMKNILMM